MHYNPGMGFGGPTGQHTMVGNPYSLTGGGQIGLQHPSGFMQGLQPGQQSNMIGGTQQGGSEQGGSGHQGMYCEQQPFQEQRRFQEQEYQRQQTQQFSGHTNLAGQRPFPGQQIFGQDNLMAVDQLGMQMQRQQRSQAQAVHGQQLSGKDTPPSHVDAQPLHVAAVGAPQTELGTGQGLSGQPQAGRYYISQYNTGESHAGNGGEHEANQKGLFGGIRPVSSGSGGDSYVVKTVEEASVMGGEQYRIN